MNKENIFYVYEHWRPDQDKCFYVGKGRDRRAWDMKNDRNVHHRSVVSKLTSIGLIVDVRIIVRDISSATAAELEKDRISFHGVENLTNMNRGGGGVIRHSPEAIAKISATSKGRKSRLGSKLTQETKDKLSAIGLQNKEKFSRYSAMGPKAMAKKVICIDDGIIFDSASAAARHYGLRYGVSISSVCRGDAYRLTAAGRRFKYVDDAA